MFPVKSPEQPSAPDIENKYKGLSQNEADELPPGWTIESNTRKAGSINKVDRRYTDPVTGYIFRSLKDAQRYIKTGKLGRLAIKPKNNQFAANVDYKHERLHEQMSETGESELLHRASKRPPSPPEAKTRQVKCPSLPQPETRRATRQSGIKIDSPPPSPPDTRNNRQAARARLVSLATPKEKNKKIEAEKMIHKHDENGDMDCKKTEMGPATLPLCEDQPPPVDVKEQELPVVNPAVSKRINFSRNDLWTDPCINIAVKTLKKPENPSPPSLAVPLEELWTDPCIEFAVKTLTGAIPVGQDDAHMTSI